MENLNMDTNSIFSLIQGFRQIEGGFHSIIKTLADSNNTDTVIFKELCKVRDNIEAMRKSLNPSVFL